MKNAVILLSLLSGCHLNNAEPTEVLNLARHDEKVELCHVPPGNPENAQTLFLSNSGATNHLLNHQDDHLGVCTCEDTKICEPTDTGDTGSINTDTDTDTDFTEDTDTSTDTGDEDSGIDSGEDTGIDDTDTSILDTGVTKCDTDLETDVFDTQDTGTDIKFETDTGLNTGDLGETWVQNGCQTVPAGSGFLGLLTLIFVRKNRSL